MTKLYGPDGRVILSTTSKASKPLFNAEQHGQAQYDRVAWCRSAAQIVADHKGGIVTSENKKDIDFLYRGLVYQARRLGYDLQGYLRQGLDFLDYCADELFPASSGEGDKPVTRKERRRAERANRAQRVIELSNAIKFVDKPGSAEAAIASPSPSTEPGSIVTATPTTEQP